MILKKLTNPAETLPALFMAGSMVAGILSGLSTNADAAIAINPGPPWDIKSSVTADVTNNGDGTWTYQYTVFNNSEYGFDPGTFDTPVIVDWEIPYFADAGITSISAPTSGWNWVVETIGTPNLATGWSGIAAWQDPTDPFYTNDPNSPFNQVTEVLHWFVDLSQIPGAQPSDVGIWPFGPTPPVGAHQNSLGGFGFTANFEPTDGPYQASWYLVPTPRTGDPPLPGGLLPASPCTTNWSPQCGGQQVPEPGTLLLAGLGLGLLSLPLLRKRA